MGNVLEFKRKESAADVVARQIAACAWRGFLAMGRGAVVIDLESPTIGVDAWYFARGSEDLLSILRTAKDEGYALASVDSMLEEYDPQLHIVVVALMPENRLKLQVRIASPSPPEAFELENKSATA